MALTDLYGKILATGMQVIRRETYLPALVNNLTVGDRTQASSVGGTTEVIVPPEFTTRSVVPASTPPASAAAPNPTTVQVTLDHWEEVNFPLTEKHITLIESADERTPMFIANAVSPIIEKMTESIALTAKGIYGVTGTAGLTPFGASPIEAQNAKKIMTQQKCPKFMRKMLLNTEAYANATGLAAFTQALNYGSPETIREGEVRRAYGFDWIEDVGIDDIRHVNPGGTPAGWLVNGAVAVGARTMVIDTGAIAPVFGDIFTVAGDTQTYVVNSFAAGSLSFSPAAQTAFADNAAITFVPAHAINLAFHPMAFAFDSRPAARLNLAGVTNNFMTWVDEMTGITLRLEIREEYHQTGLYLSCLWGTKLVDPRLAVRILG